MGSEMCIRDRLLGVGGTGRATVAGLGLVASGWGVAVGVGEPGVLMGPCSGGIAGWCTLSMALVGIT